MPLLLNNLVDNAIGNASNPVYLNAQSALSPCSPYAGGTAVTLNGTSKKASEASLYAPTGAGASGQVLKSTGGVPAWEDITSVLPQGTSYKDILLYDNGWRVSNLNGTALSGHYAYSYYTCTLTDGWWYPTVAPAEFDFFFISATYAGGTESSTVVNTIWTSPVQWAGSFSSGTLTRCYSFYYSFAAATLSGKSLAGIDVKHYGFCEAYLRGKKGDMKMRFLTASHTTTSSQPSSVDIYLM